MSDTSSTPLVQGGEPAPEQDPEPVAPTPPGPDACCHSGCAWCVLDLYDDELERYRKALTAWQARQR